MPTLKIDRVQGHTFLKGHVNTMGTVVDLGMNRGEFARIMRDRYGSRVIGAEANPALASTNGITCRNVAISKTNGSVKFSISANPEASTIVSDNTPISETVIPVPSLTLTKFFREADITQADLMKIDVEGAELDIIETTPPTIFQRCAQISVEFHRFLHPSDAARIENAIALMTGSGFRCIDFSTDRTDVLFINSGKIEISAAASALLVMYKYQAGIIRRLHHIAFPEAA
jgi:FkbM family methyltransferase